MYVLTGRLCGHACDDCEQPLGGAEVVLYRSDREDAGRLAAAAAADPADTFAVLTDDDAGARANDELARATTDEQGRFTVRLDEGYDGGPVDVVAVVSAVDGVRPADGHTVTFSITTLQPRWRGKREPVATWEHCLSRKLWCAILGRLGVWTICGRLTTCEGGQPIPGATVSAFDADWIQDDPLGSATTDGSGRFRIAYRVEDFERTPLPSLQWEWVRGPDVYFSATVGGLTILEEDRTAGRAPGRENVGPCLCADLCSSRIAGPDPATTPHWQQVETFDVFPPAGNPGARFSAEGYADPGGAEYVFSHGVLLKGSCPRYVGGHPVEYRFVVGAWTWPSGGEDPDALPSAPPASLDPIVTVVPTDVGSIFYNGGWGTVTIKATDADGWMRVEGQSVQVKYGDGSPPDTVTVGPGTPFWPIGQLVTIDTRPITGTTPKLPGGLPRNEAGRSLTAAEKEPVRRYTLEFQARNAVTHATLMTERLDSIVFDNSPLVAAITLEELLHDLCASMHGTPRVNLRYTVDHPHLRSFFVSIASNHGTTHPPALPSHADPDAEGGAMPNGSFATSPGGYLFRGGASGPADPATPGGHWVDIAGDPRCAYVGRVHWTTRHYGTPGGNEPFVLFCT